ncbi:MAG: NAD(P)/FAD-dependent oxidoreductase [Ktedonobacteraceae bacterium]
MPVSSSIHILIIGGGLGGLCLAQGLRQAGISVAVYERDVTSIFRRQGYRIHIDARGATGLRACLPPRLFELFVATTSQPSHQVTVINKHLKQLKVIGSPKVDTTDPTRLNTAVDRLTLREILLADLADVVHFNKEFGHYEEQADGGVRVYFSDGTAVSGDVLVAADGVNSCVRQQFLPAVTFVDTGMRCIYGKTLLTEATRPLIPDFVHHGFTIAVGSQQLSLALGLVEFLHPPVEVAAQFAPDVQFHTNGDYLMWSLNAPHVQFAASDAELFQKDGLQLQHLVLQKMKRWHPNLCSLIAAGDPAEIFPFAVRVSTPCDPWASTHITLLGDAIHAMSPAGGSGANMALLDAHLLSQALISVAHGEKPLLQALHDYEAQMLKDGFEAVRFSAQGGVFRADEAPKKSLLQKLFRIVSHKHQPASQ